MGFTIVNLAIEDKRFKDLKDKGVTPFQIFRLGLDEYEQSNFKKPIDINLNSNDDYYGLILKGYFSDGITNALKKSDYTHFDLERLADEDYFEWLKFQPKKKTYVLLIKEFVRECHKALKPFTNRKFDFEDIMSFLCIDGYNIVKQIKVKGKNYGKNGVRFTYSELYEGLFHLDENQEKEYFQKIREIMVDEDIYAKSDVRSSEEYLKFKDTVLERDGVCQCCGLDKRLEVHHIYSYKKYESIRTEETNGITLCNFCHRKYHSIYGLYNNINPVTLGKFLRQYGVRK